jgi:hypothetical protein
VAPKLGEHTSGGLLERFSRALLVMRLDGADQPIVQSLERKTQLASRRD